MELQLGLGIALELLADQIAKLENQRLADRIAHLVTVPFPTQEPHVVPQHELLGDVGLLEAGSPNQFRDVGRPRLDPVQDGQRVGSESTPKSRPTAWNWAGCMENVSGMTAPQLYSYSVIL